jgi:hypothetical protein
MVFCLVIDKLPGHLLTPLRRVVENRRIIDFEGLELSHGLRKQRCAQRDTRSIAR